MGRWVTVHGHPVYIKDKDEMPEQFKGKQLVAKKVVQGQLREKPQTVPTNWRDKPFEQDFEDFKKTLATRPMGKAKGQVPGKHVEEYKATKRSIMSFIKDEDPDTEIVGLQHFASESDSTNSMNSYQRLIADDVRRINFNRKIGAKMSEQDYKNELRALKSLDYMIQERRKLLDKIKKGEW